MRLDTEPDVDWKNIFQLWRENGERVPFKVAKNTWSAEAGHFLIVERVEIKKWPYGDAWGHYHWGGRPSERKKIDAAGVYKWRLLEDDQGSLIK